MTRFIIFANAHSGSTSLTKVLAESTDVRMVTDEPFHANYTEWHPEERNYSKFIKEEQTLNVALDELFKNHNAFKCLNYQFDERIYFPLLGCKDIKVILLRRRNTAKSAVSSLIAQQTGAWHRDEAEKVQESYNLLQPIPVEEVSKIVDYTDSENKKYEDFLKEHRAGDYMSLYYEDLYSDDDQKNYQQLENICQFLGITMPPVSAIVKYMKPDNAQISADGLYKKIPNIAELEAKFGKLY